MANLMNCTEHPSSCIEYFCEPCGILSCLECSRNHTILNPTHTPLTIREAAGKMVQDIEGLHDIAYAKAFDPETNKKLKLLNSLIESLRGMIHCLEQNVMEEVARFKQRHVFDHRQNCCKFYLQARSLTSTLRELKMDEVGEKYADICLKAKEAKQKYGDALKAIKDNVKFPFERLQDRISEVANKFTTKFSEAVVAISALNNLPSSTAEACKEINLTLKEGTNGKDIADMVKNCPTLASISLSKKLIVYGKIDGEGVTLEVIKATLESIKGNHSINSIGLRTFITNHIYVGATNLTPESVNSAIVLIKECGKGMRLCIDSTKLTQDDAKKLTEEYKSMFGELSIINISTDSASK